MRLFTSTKPRFITRYQHLQDSVSQLDVGLSAEELLVNANADDALPHEEQHEQHEPSEPPKEYEAAQDQADERLLHDEEGQTLEEVEGDESYSEGQVQQHYEEQEQIFEPTSILQEQTEAFHANDETSSLHEQNTTETSSNRPLLTQDDSLSNHLLAEPKEKDDESETPTHHSTPTSGSRDIGESVHEEDAGVIALEAVEAHLHDVEYAEDVNPVNAEYKGEHELQYPVYDEEEEQETFTEEEYQEEDQGHQPQGEEYEEEGEGNEQQQNQQEHQEETQLDQIEGQHEIQGPGEVDQLHNPEQQISAGAPEPENESTYEQTTTVGEGINYSEGDHLEDVDAAFDGSALTEPTHELSRVEETERIPHDTADPPDPHPEIPDLLGRIGKMIWTEKVKSMIPGMRTTKLRLPNPTRTIAPSRFQVRHQNGAMMNLIQTGMETRTEIAIIGHLQALQILNARGRIDLSDQLSITCLQGNNIVTSGPH
ncbi:hypothetical protein BJ912DRAFT_513925 [Pholiota molesta]|nr:hypothetical protein BJ912DRAFT_513925 [Pholiota molesta]